MKQKQAIVLALSLITSAPGATAQARPTVVVGQPLAGRSGAPNVAAVLGIPGPRARMGTADRRQVETSDEVPLSLGREIRWTSFTLQGRKTGEGRADFSEAGGRQLLLTAAEVGGSGPRVVICQGLSGRSRWRRLIWVASP